MEIKLLESEGVRENEKNWNNGLNIQDCIVLFVWGHTAERICIASYVSLETDSRSDVDRVYAKQYFYILGTLRLAGVYYI